MALSLTKGLNEIKGSFVNLLSSVSWFIITTIVFLNPQISAKKFSFFPVMKFLIIFNVF